MQNYFLRNLSELAQKRAILMREEAQLWDILSRDLKREAGRLEDAPAKRFVRAPLPEKAQTDTGKEERLFVRTSEALKMMGIGRGSFYEEINAGRLKIRKSGRKTLIAISDIHAWFESLPEKIDT